MSTRQRFCWWLALVLLVARLGFVLTQQPLAGFANQFDMLRNTGCLGLQPLVDAVPGAATPQAPIERYATGTERSSSCLWGTEVLLSGLAVGLDQIGDGLGMGELDSLPLRLIAVTKALMLLLALAWLDWRLRAHANARLAHLWVAALLLADPFNSLYLAGFYTEFTALLCAWLALMLPTLWLLSNRAPSTVALLIWGLILAGLSLSRFQHALIPLALVLWLAILGLRRGWAWPRLGAWPLLILLPSLALQMGLQRQYQTIADANRWNSFFGAALPAAGDPEAFVTHLGLPVECAQLIHTTWYLQRGRDARVQCPQAFSVSRLSWALRLAAEPAAIARMVGRGVTLSGQWRPSYLGEVAGGEFQRMPRGALGLGSSWADRVSRLSFTMLLGFWLGPLLLVCMLPLVALAASSSRHANRSDTSSGDNQTQLWLWPMLLLIALLGWASSLVGDGYSELARHLHLAANATLCAWILSAMALLQRLYTGQSTQIVPLLWPAAALLLACVFLAKWVGAQGLAFGVLEQPDTETMHSPVPLAGWAMDPRGIERIELVHADGTRQRLDMYPRPELAGIFGRGIGIHGTGFSGIMDRCQHNEPFAIEVTPLQGATTIIDRRWMQAACNANSAGTSAASDSILDP